MKVNQFIRFLFFMLPSWVMAATKHPVPASGLGRVAENLLEPVGVFTQFVSVGSMLIGVCFIFASFLRYMQHRVNPLAMPLSTVFMLLILGILLLLLPMTSEIIKMAGF